MAEITKPDLITQEAADIFKDLNKDAIEFKSTLDNIRQSSKTFSDSINNNNTTASKLSETVKGLADDQKELNKIEAQIVAQNAKLTPAYQAQLKVLSDLKEQVKLKTQLGEKEAITITAQNSSINQLSVALNANRKAYSDLVNEEQRKSVQGQRLIKVIQEQDSEFKKLRVTMGQSQDNVGNYKSALEGLDNASGGAVSRIKTLGESLKALAANPFILAATILIGLFYALKNSVQTFYATTAEGEEVAQKQAEVWSAFGKTVKSAWAEVGKSVSDFFGSARDWASGFLLYFAPSLVGAFNVIADKEAELGEKRRKLIREHARDIVDDAQTEVASNEEIEKSKDKLHNSDLQRLEAIREAKRLREEQLKGDLELAKQDLDVYLTELQTLGRKTKQIGLISEMNDEQIKQAGLMEEEIKKLASLQENLIKTEANAINQRRAYSKIEQGIVIEIERAKREAEERIREQTFSVNKQLIDNEVHKNNEILKSVKSTEEQKAEALNANFQLTEKSLLEQKTREISLARKVAEERIIATKEGILLEGKEKLAAQVNIDEAYLKQIQAIFLKYQDLQKEDFTKFVNDLSAIQIIAAQKKIAAIQEGSNKEEIAAINQIKQLAIDGIITREQAEKNLAELRRGLIGGLVNDQILAIQKIINTEKLTDEQRALYDKELYKLKNKLVDELYNNIDNKEKTSLQNTVETLNKLKSIYDQFYHSIIDLSQSLAASRQQHIQLEMHTLEEKHAREIALAGDNAQAKAQIDARYAQQQKKLNDELLKDRQKQARFEKAAALIEAAIKTALAVLNQLSAGDPYTAIPRSIAVGVLGAIQIAAIAAKPIPAYYLGTDDHKGGPALVGEQGTELLTMPSGQLKLTPNRATVMDLPAGTEVLPNKETMKVLALAGLTNSQMVNTTLNMTGVIIEIKGLRDDMKRNKQRFPNYARMASGVYEFRQESDTHIKKVLALSGNH